jgi:hypothetical protein
MAEILQIRLLRAAGMLILDLFGAVLVPAILEGSIWRAFPVHTPMAIVVKIWCLDFVVASFMGFMMYRVWRSGTSKWAWVLPTLWFRFGAMLYAGHAHARSVLLQPDSFWSHFLGGRCASRALDCGEFFSFTIPFTRSLWYSLAAVVASRVLNLLPAHPDPDDATKNESDQ